MRPQMHQYDRPVVSGPYEPVPMAPDMILHKRSVTLAAGERDRQSIQFKGQGGFLIGYRIRAVSFDALAGFSADAVIQSMAGVQLSINGNVNLITDGETAIDADVETLTVPDVFSPIRRWVSPTDQLLIQFAHLGPAGSPSIEIRATFQFEGGYTLDGAGNLIKRPC